MLDAAELHTEWTKLCRMLVQEKENVREKFKQKSARDTHARIHLYLEKKISNWIDEWKQNMRQQICH